jgi:HD-GYP domain-containing protein (c-di-GMP phosphodiesterase class II)
VHERAIALLRDEADEKFDRRCVEALSRVLDGRSAATELVARLGSAPGDGGNSS